ncbi:hypothetical protein [Methylomonas sp. HYX-M1]|uniref:hypothetical protein n=1 Tax=Methylomonas sp. HYX-M1 TaxID=3139307 RepID=UPI00345B6EB1
MELIAILFFLGIYLLISIGIVKAVMAWAAQHQRRVWLWSGFATFIMYNLVFWDLIPTKIAYKYYCDTQAGYTVFKSPTQWFQENSNLPAASLKSSRKKNGIGWSYENRILAKKPWKKVSQINEFIYEDIEFMQHICCFLPINKRSYYVADARNDEKLFEYVTFWTGYDNLELGNLKNYWMINGGCMESVNNEDMVSFKFYEFINEIVKLGENNHDKQ